jgi:hypothetical protein
MPTVLVNFRLKTTGIRALIVQEERKASKKEMPSLLPQERTDATIQINKTKFEEQQQAQLPSPSTTPQKNNATIIVTELEIASVSRRRKNNENISRRISCILQQGRPDFRGFYKRAHLCGADRPLPDTLRSSLEYIPTIDTDLNLLVMGDSVGMQIAGALQKCAGHGKRKTLLGAGGNGEGITVMQAKGGRSYVAGWRILDMLLRRGQDQPLPPERGGGWRQEYVDKLFNETGGRAFDSLIFRIPQGWIQVEDVTQQQLLETVTLARELFNVSSVTFLTHPMSNNYGSSDEARLLNRLNTEITDFADQWNASAAKSTGVQHVFSLDFGGLMNQATKVIAEVVFGLDTSTDAYLDTSIVVNPGSRRPFYPPAALLCGRAPLYNITVKGREYPDCERNGLSVDGMHVCMEVLAAKTFMGFTCQQACFHNNNNGPVANDDDYVDDTVVRSCARACDQRYMSLDDSVMVEGVVVE